MRNEPNNDGVIVFVHGVTGNSRSTWTSDRTHRFWPDMLTQDPAFAGVNVFVYGYDSPRLGESLTLGELGENLRLVLSSNDIFRHRWIAFLMHSMGGLVVRSFLTEYGREEYLKRIKLLYFLSTPTEGSQLAGVFGLVSQNPQFRDLAPADRANKLGEELRRWLAARFDIASYCAYETEKTFGTLVVPMTNALALCNRPADPIPQANHLTIAKPDGPDAPQYVAFRQAFKETMLAPGPVLKGVVIADEVGGAGLDQVPVSVDEAAGSTVTQGGGKFAFVFPDKHPGEVVHVRVNKPGYAVVNEVQMEVTLPANPDLKLATVILCKEEDCEEMRRRFYRLKSLEAIAESYQKRLKELEDAQRAINAELSKLQRERDQAKVATESGVRQLDNGAFRRTRGGSAPEVELYRSAERLFVEGRIEEALHLLDDEKLRQWAQDQQNTAAAVQAWLLKAQLLTTQFRFEDAERAYLQAIEAAPDSFEANFAHAHFNQDLNHFEKARAAYDRCVEVARGSGNNAQLAMALNDLAVLDRDQNRPDQARNTFQEALQIRRRLAQINAEAHLPGLAETLINLAVLDFHQNRTEPAREEFGEALTICGDLAKRDPERFSAQVARVQRLLEQLPK